MSHHPRHKAFCDLSSAEKRARLATMHSHISSRVVGQPEAVQTVCDIAVAGFAGASKEGKPQGSYLALGPTGTGKTMLVKELVQFMFGSQEYLVALDMGGYKSPSTISRLLGSHGDDGVLARLVGELKQRGKGGFILFDEGEKACIEVKDLMLEILGEGRLTTNTGVKLDFTPYFVAMTTNINAKQAAKSTDNFRLLKDAMRAGADDELRPEIVQRFSDLAYYQKLTDESLDKIVGFEFDDLARIALTKSIPNVAPELVPRIKGIAIDKTLVSKTRRALKENESGARFAQTKSRLAFLNPLIRKLYDEDGYNDLLKMGDGWILARAEGAATVIEPATALPDSDTLRLYQSNAGA